MRKTFRLSLATASRRHVCTAFLLSICLLAVLFVGSARADNGTWAQSTSGLFWSSPANWLNNTVADGATFTADFSTVNITAPTTVNLDSPRTIGQLKFQDATTADNDWTLSNNGVAGNVLTLANGTNQPIINVLNRTATISAVLAGTNGVLVTGGNATLVLNGADTYSGVTTVNSAAGGNNFSLILGNNNALGTSTVNFNPGGSNKARILLNAGVTINNNITLNTINAVAGGNGALQANGDVTATFGGTITVSAVNTSGGGFVGAQPAGGGNNVTNNYLIFSGPIIETLPSSPKNLAGGTTSNAIVLRAGNLRFADTTGTSSYYRLEERAGVLQVGANNGIATNAYIDIGGNSNGNPVNYAILDLNGFNQTLVGVSNFVSNGNNATITNTSTTTPATLTLAPANPTTNPNQANLVYTGTGNGSGGNVSITDASASAPLSIVVNGNAAGVQYLTIPAASYRGSTTLTSGTLAISALANGGANSSIGASSNAASNLVFNGGTLRYVNNALNSSNGVVALTNSTTPSTDRNFTISAGSTGTLDVESATTTLTMSGGSAATSGTLIKAGLGTLLLTGANQHTGGTNVNGGTLLVNSPGTLATGTVTVNTGATLGGNGTIGGTVSIASGGTVAPGNLGIGTMSVGALTLNTGGFVNFEFGAATNDQITITNPGGLTLNGGNLNLFNSGASTAFSTNGTYTLLNTTGAITGALSNLTVANPAAGKLYTLASTASAVQLTIGDATTREWNNGAGTGIWTTGGNWVGGIAPNSVGESAKFGSLSAGDVDLSGNKTVSGLIFDSSSYNLKGTSSTLTLNNGVAASAITVNNGNYSISVPVSMTNSSSVAFTNNGALTISGAIGGGRPITVGGTGTLTLSGNNAYSTTAVGNGATLNIGTSGGTDTNGTLGTGNVTLSGAATLNFNRSNAYSFAGGITGSGVGAGSINQMGSGTTTIAGVISNITTVNVAAGSLVTSNTVGQTGGVNVTGNGSMTAAGIISGAGALNVSTTGTVALNANNNYTGGTTITSGTVTLGSANALPTSSVLAVNGGTLDLHGNSISLSNITDTNAGGVITNSVASTTSTINFAGANSASYQLFAAINDGAGKVAVVTNITNTQTGGIARILDFHSTGTYTGGTTITAQNIQADANDAFGTGPITITANNASTNSSQIYIAPLVTIHNNITVAQGNPFVGGAAAGTAFGVIQQTASGGDATVAGTITIQANNLNGGLFNGPLTGGPDYLNITGPVNTSGTADTIIQIGGNVRYSGGGSYPNIQITGLGLLGAANGLSQSAVIQIGNAGGGTFDLGGFDQTAAGLATVNANSAIVQNTSAGTNTLTLNTTANNTFAGSITGNVNLTVAGTGTQRLTGSNSSYTGVTKLSGTAVLEAANLSNGSSPSSIGAATNAPTNLIFDGGTLRYTGLDTTVDRGFTVTAGKSATIEVANATTNLTWSGGAASSSGGFTKTGPGTLIFPTGTVHSYTGPTAVNAGTLVVNNSLTSTSAVSVAGGAVLTGNGTIGGTFTHTAGTVNPGTVGTLGTLSFSGPVTLNGGTFQFDVDGSNLAGTQDLAKANGGLSITGPSTIDLEFLSLASVPTTPFDFTLFNYTGAAVTAAQAANLSFITNAASRATYSTNVGTAGKVIVHVVPGAAANLTWNSTSSGVWDVGTTANWLNGTTNAADKFANGDSVTFADGAGLQTNITLNTIASISGASVTSNTNNYTISGTGKITGAGALTKSGVSTLTLKTNNDFSGGTTISGGTVNVGGNSSSGSLGSGQITNNATLIYSRTDGNAFTPLLIPNSISGTGNLTLSFGGAASMTGPISQASLTANGAGAVTLSNSINTTGNVTISSGAVIANTQAQMSIGGGLTVNGSGLLNSNQPISVSNGVTVGGTASVTSTGGISGAGGITQSTTGTVTVGGSNSYDGATVINSGIFFPNNTSAFGTTNGATTVNAGGQIYTTQANINFGTEPVTINGTGTSTSGTPNNDGALRAGGATTSTFGATVNVASNSLIGLDGGATLSLAGEPALSGSNVTVSLTGGGTLSLSGSVNLGANGVLATGTSPVAFAPADSTTITVKNPLTGSGPMTITNTGASGQATIGTTVLTVDSPNYTGAINTASTATASGNVQIQTPLGLGSATVGTTINGSGTATFLVGTVQLAPTSGGMTVAEPFTLGARQGPGIDVPHLENIQGNNILTGSITTGTGGSDYNLQSDAGLLTITSNLIVPDAVTGARNLKLQGNGNGVYAGVIPNGTAATNPGIFSVIKNGAGTWTLSGVNTFTGPTVINAGKLQLGVANAISRTSLLTLNGGTLSTGGLNQDLTLGTTPAMLNLTNNSVIDLGNGASTLKLANSSTQPWSGNLSIVHWNTGSDHLLIGTDNTGLTSAQLQQVSFATYAPGVAISATGEVTPSSSTRVLKLGDFSMDGSVNADDIVAAEALLTNGLSTFGSDNGLTAPQVLSVLDVDHSGAVNNADLIGLLTTLRNGGGSLAPVPEPASGALAVIGMVAGLMVYRRRRQSL